MKNVLFKKRRSNQPISLKWKWGILLFVGFLIFGTFSSATLYLYNQKIQRNIFSQVYQKNFDAMINYLSTFETIYENQEQTRHNGQVPSRDSVNYLMPDISNYFTHLEDEDIVIRLFNPSNQLVYSSRHVQVPVSLNKGEVVFYKVNGIDHLIISSQILRKNSDEVMGRLQYIVVANQISKFEQLHLRTLLLTFLAVIVLAIIVATFLSNYFLRPLSYLNKSLDLIEEESLKEIRMRKPKNQDEWSDLTLHINRLLDKIDLYVRNQKQFVEDVSHELRTPVAIVEGHLSLLNRWGKNDPEVLEESLQASFQEIKRMKGLIQEMLDLMRADHAEVDYKDEMTEVYSTVRQVHNNFTLIYPEFTFYLDMEKNKEDLYVSIYRNHFEQLLIILMDNAVKYSLERKEIHLSVSTSFSHVEIAVQDFGEGMNDEDKNRIFGRFYRVDKARSREKGGNGLGLSIAQRLVRSYKGTIKVESALGNGSIFYISFPILSDERQIFKRKQKQREKSL